MTTPNATGGGVSSHTQQTPVSQQNAYWALLPPAAQYHAALVQAQHSTNDMSAGAATGPNAGNAAGGVPGATNSANSNTAASANSNNMHMFAYNRAAANNSQVQF